MLSSSLPSVSLAQLAANGAVQTVILTVNNRLARRLVGELGKRLRDAGISAAAAPAVMPVSAWIDSLAEQAAFDADAGLPAYRLDDFAARLLWRDAILHHSDTRLLDAHEAARLAAEAEHLVQEWHVAPADDAHEEYVQFMRWRKQYRVLLGACDADDADTRMNLLLAQLRVGMLRIPEQIVLAGMREVSPRQQAMLAALEERGCEIRTLQEEAMPAGDARRFAATDPGGEWRAAVAWAARQLAAGEGRYAIVAANLQDKAPFARRVLHRGLDGQPFNLSVARALNEWPLVAAALAWLDLLAQSGPYAPADLARALLAGHCAGQHSEATARTRLDAVWRFQQDLWLGPNDWQSALQACPKLREAWPAAVAAFDRHASRTRVNSAADWAQRMRHGLAQLGFPGDAALDSTAYQVFEAFQQLLQRFAALTPAAPDLSATEAVLLLARLARETPFQPERAANARLDILGLLEAEGERWDGVWILGMTDDVLPAPPSPNPLLPASALAEANAPRATAARELAYAHDLFGALLHCAPNVIVSHAVLDGERELRPSPMVALLPLLQAPEPDDATAPLPRVALQALHHDPGPPLAPNLPLSGGTAILEAQSRNPLWAFVRYRLGARTLPAHARQLATSALRGNFLHHAMQTLWEALRASRALAEASVANTLAPLLEHAIEMAALRELQTLSPVLRELECVRASQVLSRWLELEALRQPFEIAHIEGKQQWQRGPLRLTLRLDRVDRLHSGALVILDYKSGTQLDIKGWMRQRPVSLQLPFYAAVLADVQENGPATIGALVLARLNAREVGALGVGGEPIGLPGVQDLGSDPEPSRSRKPQPFTQMGWDDWLAHWQQSIARLADEFIAGRADNIALHPADLQYCDVLPFLRHDLEADTDEATP